ncbi:MAG TPA: hypothetical protein VKK31_09490 [Thermoanaerobaculia bacterium]|nr:hypothetical protein [Thermoanaerobaculia bacterium]
MRTPLLMTVSSVLMFLLGALLSFLPQEVLIYLGGGASALPVLLVQVTGALYLGFAFLNWTARANLLGGIYNRPIALGNFLHFAVVALALLKAVLGGQRHGAVLAGALGYAVMAVWFGLVVFTHPARAENS